MPPERSATRSAALERRAPCDGGELSPLRAPPLPSAVLSGHPIAPQKSALVAGHQDPPCRRVLPVRRHAAAHVRLVPSLRDLRRSWTTTQQVACSQQTASTVSDLTT